MEVTFHSKDGGSYVVAVKADDTVRSLKMRMLEGMARAPQGRMVALQLRGSTELLDDTALVSSTALKAGDSVDVVPTPAAIVPGVLSANGMLMALSGCNRLAAVTCSLTGHVATIDTETHTTLRTFPAYGGRTPAFSPCNRFLLTASLSHCTPQLHFVSSGIRLPFPSTGRTAVWTPQGCLVTAADTSFSVYKVDDEVCLLHQCDIGRRAALLAATREGVLTGHNTCSPEMRCVLTGALLFSMVHTALVSCGAVSHDERHLVTSSLDAIHIWDATTGTAMHTMPTAQRCFALSLSHGSLGAAYDNRETVHLFSLDTGALCATHPRQGTTQSNAFALSSCAHWLFLGSNTGVHITALAEPLWNDPEGEAGEAGVEG